MRSSFEACDNDTILHDDHLLILPSTKFGKSESFFGSCGVCENGNLVGEFSSEG